MKSFTFLLTASCFALFLSSCKKEPLKADKETSFNTPFKSIVNEDVALIDEKSKVLVQVKNISDHRCTNHLNCDDPGLATVRVELTDTRSSMAESLLYIGLLGEENKNTDSVSVRLDDKLYLVTLHSVNPHPIMQSTEVQTVELSVKPK